MCTRIVFRGSGLPCVCAHALSLEVLDCPACVHTHCLQRFWTALRMYTPSVFRGSGLPCVCAHPLSLEVLALGLSLQ